MLFAEVENATERSETREILTAIEEQVINQNPPEKQFLEKIGFLF